MSTRIERGLDDVGQRRPLDGEHLGHVLQRLAELGDGAARDQRGTAPVVGDQADLARGDDPVADPAHRGVGTDGWAHARSSRPADAATSRRGARAAACDGSATRSGSPSAIHAAASVATKTASEPLTGQPLLLVEPHGHLGHVARGEDAEGADGQVDRLAGVVDGDALAPHQPERLVHRAQRVGAQRDRTEHLAGPDVDVDAAARPSPRRRSTLARPAPGHARRGPDPRPVGPGGGVPRRAGRRAPRPTPAPRRSGATGGPATSTSSTRTPGHSARRRATSGARSAEPSVRPTRTMPVPSGRSPSAEGRPLGPAAHHVLAAPQDADGVAGLVGQRAGPGRHRAVLACPPKAPPLPSGEAGAPPGRHQLASGST